MGNSKHDYITRAKQKVRNFPEWEANIAYQRAGVADPEKMTRHQALVVIRHLDHVRNRDPHPKQMTRREWLNQRVGKHVGYGEWPRCHKGPR